MTPATPSTLLRREPSSPDRMPGLHVLSSLLPRSRRARANPPSSSALGIYSPSPTESAYTNVASRSTLDVFSTSGTLPPKSAASSHFSFGEPPTDPEKERDSRSQGPSTFLEKTPAGAAARKAYLKQYFLGVFAIICLVFAAFSIFWGSLYKSPVRNLDGWIVVSAYSPSDMVRGRDNERAYMSRTSTGA